MRAYILKLQQPYTHSLTSNEIVGIALKLYFPELVLGILKDNTCSYLNVNVGQRFVRSSLLPILTTPVGVSISTQEIIVGRLTFITWYWPGITKCDFTKSKRQIAEDGKQNQGNKN